MEIPFVGPSYDLESRPSGVQRTVNLIPHPQEPGNERTAWVFKDVDGLEVFASFQSGVASDWLGYNVDDFGPAMQNFGVFAPLSAPPVPWVGGTLFSNLFANNIDTVWVPLSGGAATVETLPAIVENVNWFPATPGGTPPEINPMPAGDPSDGIWTGNDWVINGTASGYILLEGPSGVTTITFVINPGGGPNYDGASLLYGEEI